MSVSIIANKNSQLLDRGGISLKSFNTVSGQTTVHWIAINKTIMISDYWKKDTMYADWLFWHEMSHLTLATDAQLRKTDFGMPFVDNQYIMSNKSRIAEAQVYMVQFKLMSWRHKQKFRAFPAPISKYLNLGLEHPSVIELYNSSNKAIVDRLYDRLSIIRQL